MQTTQNVLLASALLLSSATQAQKVIIEETKEAFAVGTVSAFKTTIPYAKLKDVTSEWKKWQKEHKGAVKETKGVFFSDNTVVTELGSGTVDIYSTLKEKDATNVDLIVAYDFDGKYINCAEIADKCAMVKTQLKDFGLKMALNQESEELKDAKKMLDKSINNQKDLEKDNADYNKNIAKNKTKTEKNVNELTFKEEALTKKKDEVAIQKRVVDASAAAVDEQAKSAKKIYEKLKSAQLDLEKDIKNLKNDNIDCKDNITKNEAKLKENETAQVTNKKNIVDQTAAVDVLNSKIKTLTE
jgi:hypothetical protein